MRGKFISLEGTEGAGKSTVLNFISYYLTKQNIKFVSTREPGGTELAEEIRALLLHPKSSEYMEAETELLLMFAGRVQNLQNRILPELAAGNWVISDRFIDASYAYQGGGRGVDESYIAMLDNWLISDHYPDLTLLLDIPPEVGIIRAEKRGTNKDRIEKEALDFFNRVRDAYLMRAKQDPKRIKIVNANVSIAEVEQQLAQLLDAFILEQAP